MEILVSLRYERKNSDGVIAYTNGTDGSKQKNYLDVYRMELNLLDLFCIFKLSTSLIFSQLLLFLSLSLLLAAFSVSPSSLWMGGISVCSFPSSEAALSDTHHFTGRLPRSVTSSLYPLPALPPRQLTVLLKLLNS